MRSRSSITALCAVVSLAACGGSTAADAGFAGPDAFAEMADAAAPPSDTAAPPLDTGAPSCPSPQTGSYTFEGTIPMACPPGTGEFSYSVDVAFTPGTCDVSFTSSGDAGWLLRVMGTAVLSPTGTLGPTTFSLNGVEVTCSATYMEGSPQRFFFDCGDCDFTIRYGE